MKAACKDKAGRMLAADERRLAALVPGLLADLGFKGPDRNGYWLADSAYNCPLRVWPIVDTEYTDGHPWLACCFMRESLRPWTPGRHNLVYEDIRRELPGVADYTGKYNCHIFDRYTVAAALELFRGHLAAALQPA